MRDTNPKRLIATLQPRVSLLMLCWPRRQSLLKRQRSHRSKGNSGTLSTIC